MHRFTKLPITLLCVFSLTIIGCELLDENENAVHEELSSLLIELESATASGQEDALQTVISKTERVKPYSPYQTDTRNYILSTAQGSLAQTQFIELQSRANQISNLFKIASEQAQQTQLLRTLAEARTVSDSGTENIIPGTERAYKELQSEFQQSLSGLMVAVDKLDNQENQTQSEANLLRIEAESLFDDAASKGIIEGHSDFKDGVKVMRLAHEEQLKVSEYQLQTRMVAAPALDNRRAEIEAVASILNGIEHSKELLSAMKATASTNATLIRDTATEFDNTAATTLQSALDRSSALMSEWDTSIALMQKALQKSSRARSATKDMQEASEAWKFDMELSLGMAEESRRRFLTAQANAVQSMINNNIATSSTKWTAMVASTQDAIEHATSAAIASYENAKLVAPSGSNISIDLTQGIDQRIAVLHGKPVFIETAPTTNTTSRMTGTTSSSGFHTPRDLVEAMNTLPQLGTRESLTTKINLYDFYMATDEAGEKHIAFLDGFFSATFNLLSAVEKNFSQEDFDEMLRQQGASGDVFKDTYDVSTISVHGDTATVLNAKGQTKTLQKTPAGWKSQINGIGRDADVLNMMIEMLGPMIDVMNDAAEKVNNGTINSIEDLQALMMNSADPF
ncbi:MAG: hypothetical protein VX615_01045 [Planctomycetota bacterium]|nr:hypothetical protein [Planctomycetota bacterium]